MWVDGHEGGEAGRWHCAGEARGPDPRARWSWVAVGLGQGHRSDYRGSLLVPTDHLPDMALPEHDHGKQGPGET